MKAFYAMMIATEPLYERRPHYDMASHLTEKWLDELAMAEELARLEARLAAMTDEEVIAEGLSLLAIAV